MISVETLSNSFKSNTCAKCLLAVKQ